MKSGIYTTEFWLTGFKVATAEASTVLLAAHPGFTMPPVVAALGIPFAQAASFLAVHFYIKGRVTLKSNTPVAVPVAVPTDRIVPVVQ